MRWSRRSYAARRLKSGLAAIGTAYSIHDKGSVVGQSRPDRVMVKGGRAVIVDYKFGAEKLKIYRQKMEYYKELISRMGYTSVEGYLWYLTRSEIEKV